MVAFPPEANYDSDEEQQDFDDTDHDLKWQHTKHLIWLCTRDELSDEIGQLHF